MKVLGLIPARLGSTEVKKKNIRELCGKPLIYYTITEALKSRKLDKVILSTESEEIRKIGMSYGVEAPFLRPDYLASNEALALPVILHALDSLYKNNGYLPDAVLYMQPTSPFRTANHIDESIELIENNSVDSVMSIVPVDQHPYFMFKRDTQQNLVEYVDISNKPQRRQDLPDLWEANCSIMLSTVSYLRSLNEDEWILNYRHFVPYHIDKTSGIDIDTEFDFKLAEFMMQHIREAK